MFVHVNLIFEKKVLSMNFLKNDIFNVNIKFMSLICLQGEEGVKKVLQLLQEEFSTAMAFSGNKP